MAGIGSARRTAAVAAFFIFAVGALAPPASAGSVMDGYLREKRRIQKDLVQIRELRQGNIVRLIGVIHRADRALERGRGLGMRTSPQRGRTINKQLRHERWKTRERLHRFDRYTTRRVNALLRRRDAINVWLETWGIFRRCPVEGSHVVADNFGITVRLPNVPIHRHMGNDISAYTGTPIVAPFDGYAYGSSSSLGGLEVRVRGERGYVYNAHLSAFGRLGYVEVGAVIGYVGSTGDATAPHDHFEWHPWDGGAVDPNPYLMVVC